MDISIIICTYDRLDSFIKTLTSIAYMEIPSSLTWELIIVDNNSHQDTQAGIIAAVEELRNSHNINAKYLFESKQGKCYALNTGISAAVGEIVAFTDDDVLVDKQWIAVIYKAFKTLDPSCIGGKILPIWEIAPPKWLNKEIHNCLALLDISQETTLLTKPLVYGCNMAIKKTIISESGMFNLNKGPRPGKTWGGEETELVVSILNNNGNIYYCPDMLVYHCIPKRRIKKQYFRKWKYDSGEFTALHLGRYTERNLLGIPLYVLRSAVKSLFIYVIKLLIQPSNSFIYQLNFIYYVGYIFGRIKYGNKSL